MQSAPHSPPLQRLLIAYGDTDTTIAATLKDAFESQSISVFVFLTNRTEHWINRWVFRKINKLARNLRLIPKGGDLFSWSGFSFHRFMEAEFQKQVAAFGPDLIFCIHGERFADEFLQNTPIPKIGWWTEPDRNDDALIRHAKPFDLYFSYDSELVPLLRQHGIASQYLSHATSPAQFFPIPDAPNQCDILFFGNWSPWREAVLYAAYQVTQRIHLYGNNWHKKRTLFSSQELSQCHKGIKLVGPALNQAMNGARLVLNAQRLKGFTTGLDTRFFDVLASGNLLVSDAPKDLEAHFSDGEHLVVYDDLESLQRQLQTHLHEGRENQRIRRTGMNAVLERYTYRHFCETIIAAYTQISQQAKATR